MTFKSRIKYIFEQIVIIGILALISTMIGSVLSSICNEMLFHSLSYNIYQALHGIFKSIYLILIIIVDVIVMIHVFRTRYLDYYNNLKSTLDNTDEGETEVKEKIEIFKTKDERIVIRDPRHSEYKFITDY